MAGFGTAGSLLAGAALLFVIASAAVSFKGWPQVTTESSPVAVFQTRTPSAVAVDRVSVVAAAATAETHRARAAAANTAPGTPTSAATHLQPVDTLSHGPVPRRHLAPPAGPGAPSAPVTTSQPASTPCTTGDCALHTVGTALGNTTAAATGGLGQTVSGAGKAIGTIISGVVGDAGAKLSLISPSVGRTVTAAGTALGSTLSTTTSALGNTVAGAGQALGHVLAGLGATGS